MTIITFKLILTRMKATFAVQHGVFVVVSYSLITMHLVFISA